MTWAPTSLCGFSSTGFMCTLGAIPQARACSAWARPISPPSVVTAALFDMFCGLNGRTRLPLRAKARQSPATISDLPTSDPVPWNMMATGFIGSKLDTLLCLDAVAERMLHHLHLGHEIGELDDLVLGVAAGETDVEIGTLALQ